MTSPTSAPAPADLPPQLRDRPATVQLPLADGALAALERRPDGAARGTVLCVPGYTGSKEDLLPLLAPLAAAGWRAVAVDQRGQYESAGPDDEAAYSVDRLAADLLALAATLPGPVHVVAHSFGGLVARAAVLADDPDARLLHSVVLLASGPHGDGMNPARSGPMRLLRPVVAHGGMPGVLAAFRALQAANPAHVAPSPVLAAFLDERFLASTAAGLLGMGDALLAEPDRTDALAASGVPVLVLHGPDDDAWPPALQAEMARRLGAAHQVVPGTAHSPAVENPAATVAAVLAWLAERP